MPSGALTMSDTPQAQTKISKLEENQKTDFKQKDEESQPISTKRKVVLTKKSTFGTPVEKPMTLNAGT
jgi:hypothetical protein